MSDGGGAGAAAHGRFERKEDGTWSVLVEKRPTKESLLTPLVEKLLALFGKQ